MTAEPLTAPTSTDTAGATPAVRTWVSPVVGPRAATLRVEAAPADAHPDAGPDGTDAATEKPSLTSPPRLTALALQAAAVGHVIAALAHLSHGWSVAVFFLVAAAVQLFTAGRLARGSAGTAEVLAVLAGTVGLVLLYVASRTINLPFGGPHVANNDRPQDPDLLGTVVVFAELVALGAAPALLPEQVRRWATTGLLAVGAGMWAAWAFGLV